MPHNPLTLKGFINEIATATKGTHPRKFCFILGSGASKSSGIKTAQELVRIWEHELLERNKEEHEEWKKDNKITEENQASFYSQYYERRYERFPEDGRNFLESEMEGKTPSIGYVILAYLLAKTQNNVVVTTNFDHLVEDAVSNYEHIMPKVIGHEALAHFGAEETTRPTIIKIHRDLLFSPKNKADELENLDERLEPCLSSIFEKYHPIVIGYGGNDKSLMDFLIKNADKFKNDEWKCPYWCEYGKAPSGGYVPEFLDKSNSYLTVNVAFDGLMIALGDVFGYKLPEEDEFIEKSRERYQKLKDSFDKYLADKSGKNPANDPDGDGGGPSADNSSDDEPDDVRAVIDESYKSIVSSSKPSLMHLAAVVMHGNGEYAEALKLKNELVKLEPDNARYQDSLGVTLHEMKRYDEALPAKQKAVELEPDNARYQVSLGVTLHELKRYDEALAASQKAVVLEPNNARYQVSLGVTLHELKRYDEALAAFQKAVVLEPDNALYQDSLGIMLHKMERYDEALAAKKKAVELEPDNARYRDSLGVTLHEMKRYDEALAAKKKAVELEPDNARYQDSLGVTLHQMKRYDEALAAKKKAVELEPDNARYQDSLGVTLHQMKRYDEALAAKKKAVELEPDNEEYKTSLKKTEDAIKIQ